MSAGTNLFVSLIDAPLSIYEYLRYETVYGPKEKKITAASVCAWKKRLREQNE